MGRLLSIYIEEILDTGVASSIKYLDVTPVSSISGKKFKVATTVCKFVKPRSLFKLPVVISL